MIPRPTSSTTRPGRWTLTAQTGVEAPPQIAALLRELLTPATGLPLRDAVLDDATSGHDVIRMRLDGTAQGLAELGEEGYRLRVAADGVQASAATVAGLRWAVQAVRQLLPVQVYGPPAAIAWELPYVEIVDRPHYPWRGAMLDVARWHKPIEWLHTFVDLLAMHRMNVMHLHLTDDQGWRFEVRRYPALTAVGAYRRESPAGHEWDNATDGNPHGGYYTQDELRELVAYAARRGVTIVPEIDLPGHTRAVLAAYPELGNKPGDPLAVGTRWGIYEQVLNCDDATVEFMRNVLDELVDVFPSAHIHLGGDEVPPAEWSASPSARQRLAELGLTDPQQLLGWWIGQLSTHLRGHGRRVVVWDELVGSGAPADAVIMAWRGQDRVTEAVLAGHDVISSPVSHTYLDYNESLDPGEPLSIGSGPTPLALTYGYDPESGLPPVRPDGAGTVLGLQGNLWCEYLPDPRRAEYNLLPRLSAIAEIGWGTRSDPADFTARLAEQLTRFDAAGVTYRRPG